MASTIKTAAQINDVAFLEAYNNADLSNAEMLAQLETDWTAIGVKLRSARLKTHLLVERTGGANGTVTKLPKKSIKLEGHVWAAHKTVQPQPNGQYVTLAERVKAKLIKIDKETFTVTEVNPAEAKTASTTKTTATKSGVQLKSGADHDASVNAETTASNGATTTAADTAFRFTAKIYGNNHNIEGNTRKLAMQALFEKLQDVGFSKVAVKRNGSVIDLADVRNGDTITIDRQLTAATAHA